MFLLTRRYQIAETDQIGGKFPFDHSVGCTFLPEQSILFISFCMLDQIEIPTLISLVHWFHVETKEVMNRAPNGANTGDSLEVRY